jgi:hypothetical protein
MLHEPTSGTPAQWAAVSAGSSLRMIGSPPPGSEIPVVTPKRRRSSAASLVPACQNASSEPTV